MLEQKIKELMEALKQDQQGDAWGDGKYIYRIWVSQNPLEHTTSAQVHMQWPRWLKWVRSCITDATYEARRVPDVDEGNMHITAKCGAMEAVVVLNKGDMLRIMEQHTPKPEVFVDLDDPIEAYWELVKHYECL